MSAMQQVPDGNALIPFLERAAQDLDQDAWFRGMGTLEDVVLLDHEGAEVAFVDGKAALVSLDAAWLDEELQVTAVLLVPYAGGVTTLSGIVREATARGVTLFVFGAGDTTTVAAATEASSAPEPARRATSAPAPAPAPQPEPAAAASPWDRVAAVSQALDEEDDFDIDDLEKNDVLIHPHVGRCKVWAVLGNDAVSVMLPSGKTRKLKLSMFRLIQQGGKREFLLERA